MNPVLCLSVWLTVGQMSNNNCFFFFDGGQTAGLVAEVLYSSSVGFFAVKRIAENCLALSLSL